MKDLEHLKLAHMTLVNREFIDDVILDEARTVVGNGELCRKDIVGISVAIRQRATSMAEKLRMDTY